MKGETSNAQHSTLNVEETANSNAPLLRHSKLNVECCAFRPLLRWAGIAGLFLLFAIAGPASAQTNLTTGFGPVQITLGGQQGPQDVDTGIKLLFVGLIMLKGGSAVRSMAKS